MYVYIYIYIYIYLIWEEELGQCVPAGEGVLRKGTNGVNANRNRNRKETSSSNNRNSNSNIRGSERDKWGQR